MAKRKKSAKKNKKKQNSASMHLLGFSLMFLSIFSYVALLFKKSGIVGSFTKNLLLGLFSFGAFIFPILLLLFSITFIGKKKKFVLTKKYAAIILVLLDILCVLFLKDRALFEYDKFAFIRFTVDSYTYGGQFKGGGILGNYFGKFVVSLIGFWGAFVLIIFTFVIAYMLYTNISPGSILGAFKDILSKKKKNVPKKTKVKIKDNTITPALESENEAEAFDSTYNKGATFFDGKKELKYLTADIPKASKDEQAETANIETKVSEVPPENNKEKSDLPQLSHFSYTLPPLDLLNQSTNKNGNSAGKESMNNAGTLNQMLKNFGVGASVSNITIGPAVTRYELQLNPGVKVSKIVGLSDDIALALASSGIRIEAPIPGKSAVGIEVPNSCIATISLREILVSGEFKNAKSKLSFGIGKDIAGSAIVGDLSKMPHLLIAGATGSGKSVCINTIIASILYKSTPHEVKLIMIDPKVVELSVYNNIPHLLIPVVTEPKKAASALNWAVSEMTERYKKFADSSVRDINGYNLKDEIIEKMPQIVIIIDELADLMMVTPGEIEDYICRLAQMARAAGMHLIVATQRPSVDVITGLIKANIPSRISFAVSSQTDSRTILDTGGAEKLLGKGDMLYYPVGEAKPKRVQGAFISDKEVEKLVDFVKKQGETTYSADVIEKLDSTITASNGEVDSLLSDAIKLVVDYEQASASMLQRKLKIGYNRAACLMEEMEKRRIIGEYEGSKPRKVLLTKEELDELNEMK